MALQGVPNGSELKRGLYAAPAITHETAVFAHAVNSRAKLDAALKDGSINMLEADVITARVRSSISNSNAAPAGPGPRSTSDTTAAADESGYTLIAVMGHDPGSSTWDLTFDDFAVAAAAAGGKGIKVDLKEHAALPLVLATLQKLENGTHPAFHMALNADANGAGACLDEGGQLWPYFRLYRTTGRAINSSTASEEAGDGDASSNASSTAVSSSASPAPPPSQPTPVTAAFDVPAVIINADVLTGTTSPFAPGCRFNSEGKVLPLELGADDDGGSGEDGSGDDDSGDAHRSISAPGFTAAVPPHAYQRRQISEARAVIRTVCESLPLAILSLGWTTAAENREYTSAMVDEMLRVVHDHAEAGLAFTFPVRGTYVRKSWQQLRRLVDPAVCPAFACTSLTVWSNVGLREEDESWMRANLDPARTMYDVPPRPSSASSAGAAANSNSSSGPSSASGSSAGSGSGAAPASSLTAAVFHIPSSIMRRIAAVGSITKHDLHDAYCSVLDAWWPAPASSRSSTSAATTAVVRGVGVAAAITICLLAYQRHSAGR